MPSNNSYNYFQLFEKCVFRKYASKFSNDGLKAICNFMFEMMKTAPSKQVEGAGWCDDFLTASVFVICTGEWCKNPHCEHNRNGKEPYNCGAGKLPFQCKEWKNWRLMWRSYPEKEVCQKCKYYKPVKATRLNITWAKKENQHKCYCRAKELPADCPKRSKENVTNGKA